MKVELIGLLEVAETATKPLPSPALLQKHSLGGCTIRCAPSCQTAICREHTILPCDTLVIKKSPGNTVIHTIRDVGQNCTMRSHRPTDLH